MLDPIADKLLVGATLMMLAGQGRFSHWGLYPAIVIMLREILVSGLREYLAGIRVGLPVTQLAKWKTGFQMGALGTLLAGDRSAVLLHVSFLPVTLIGVADAVGRRRADADDRVGLPHCRPAPRHHRAAQRRAAAARRSALPDIQMPDSQYAGTRHRRLVRQRQDHAAHRAAAAAARRRPDRVHRQARASRVRHGPPGQGHVTAIAQAGAHEVLVASGRRWALLHEVDGAEPALPACWRGWSRWTWCWWKASRRIHFPSSRCTARRSASRRSGPTQPDVVAVASA